MFPLFLVLALTYVNLSVPRERGGIPEETPGTASPRDPALPAEQRAEECGQSQPAAEQPEGKWRFAPQEAGDTPAAAQSAWDPGKGPEATAPVPGRGRGAATGRG